MKVEQVDTGIRGGGFGKTFDFKIKSDRAAFDALFAKMYADPQKAIIRELSTNCFDTHAEVGKQNVPFEVHMPNKMDPTLSFRDFGTGISPLQMEEVYTTVFESTRNQSNDYAGKFGLGCKTPFSYADNYVIESWQDGRYFIYNAFRNQEGVPSLGIVDEKGIPSNEPDGTKITIPIREIDFSTIYSKAEEIYAHFAVPPVVKGYQLKIERPEYAAELKHCKIRKSGNLRAVMGNISYPLTNQDYRYGYNYSYNIYNCPLDVEFDIGELEVMPSRESLHYDDKTNNNIEKKLDLVKKNISEYITNEIASAKNMWEARALYSDLTSKLKIYCDAYYNGKKVTVDNFYLNRSYYIWDKRGRRSSAYYLRPHGDLAVVKNDKNRGSHIRAKHHAETNQIDVLLIPEDKLDDFLNLTSYPKGDVILSSSMFQPKTASTTKKKVEKICVFNGNGWSSNANSYWDTAAVDLNGKGLYVEINRGRYGTNGKHHPKALKTILRALDDFGIKYGNIYGVKTRFVPKLGKKWTKLEDFVEQNIDVAKLKEKHVNAHVYIKTKYSYTPFSDIAADVLKFIKGDPRKDWEELVSIKKDKGKDYYNLFLALGVANDVSKEISDKVEEFNNLAAKLEKRYPLVCRKKKESIHYVRLIEKENGNV